ncbi:hypothetical protein F5Y16DRAFT_40289 [Xylariaceae sp. FL0255]|nr:hypothetical protein F5Y16DRAFT_40289 [Xylariaceae sp. FL0255]
MTMAELPPLSSITYPLQQPSLISMLGGMENHFSWIGSTLTRPVINHVQLHRGGMTGEGSMPVARPFAAGFTAFFHEFRESAWYESKSSRVIIPDRIVTAFFNQAWIASNQSPATSLSALLTLLTSMMYYDQYPTLTKRGTAEVTTLATASYPQAWGGFIAVSVLLFAHLGTCFAILYLLITQTRATRLGNVWSSIAQIISSGTEEIISEAVFASDTEIKMMVRKQDSYPKHVRLRVVKGIGNEDHVALTSTG